MKKSKLLTLLMASIVILIVILVVIATTSNSLQGEYKAESDEYDLSDFEIGKSFTIVLTYEDIRDFRIADSEELSLLKGEELKKLKEYMQTNDLLIKSGEYTFNQTYTLDQILEVLKWESKE